MNNIYIVNNSFNIEVELIFKNNTFTIYDLPKNLELKDEHTFDLIDHNKIILYWNKIDETIISEIYYTKDSYIYYNNEELGNNFKKIFMIHNEWNDQAIIDLEKNKLFRIKHKDQFGTFKLDDNKLIINWNHWGEEIYYKYDDYNYYQQNYNIENNKSTINDNIKIHIFIHITLIEGWLTIFNDQISKIKECGLYDKVEKIHLGILGNLKIFIESTVFNDPKFNILYIDSKVELYEIHTINHIKNICNKIENVDNNDLYILYIHTKGVRNAGNKDVTKSWRSMMEYFLIEKHNECLNYLEYYDCIGNNLVNLFCNDKSNSYVNENHSYHYSGNFWWSKKSYIDKLDYLPLDMSNESIKSRYKAENWICSKYPDAKLGVIFQDDTNTHPYHRYVFDYYKMMNFNIKSLKYL
jgi:hypothetical protein